MFSRKADGPLTVQIPAPGQDRPSWTRVGVITAIGFIVGVAWPRLAGVRLGPSVPEATPTVASAAPPASETPGAAPLPVAPAGATAATVAVPAVAASPAPAASAPPPLTVTVGRGVVFSCRTSDGDSLKGGDCGSLPGLDSLVMPRLRKLAECPEAAGASGKVHFVVHLDFPRGGVSVDLGRGHAVPAPDALLACAKADVTGVGLTTVVHENPRYSVAYSVTFAGGNGAAAASASGTPRAGGESAEGSAQVVWEVAIVRDAPKTGKVVARLQHGTELHLGPAKDGWYPIKFGDGFASEGWIYRGAIGR
jgi:hypothetical protein